MWATRRGSGSCLDVRSFRSNTDSAGLFLDRDRRRVLRVFPRQLQRSDAGRISSDLNRELVYRAGQGVLLQIDSGYIQCFVVGLFRVAADAPLPDLFVDDQFGFAVCGWKGSQRIGTGRDGCAAEFNRLLGDEQGSLVRTGAPDLVIRHKSAPDFTNRAGIGVLGVRASVNDHDPVAADYGTDGLMRTGSFLLSCRRQDAGYYGGDEKQGVLEIFHDKHNIPCARGG